MLKMNRSVKVINGAVGAATSRAKEIKVEKSFFLKVSNSAPFLGKPKDLRDVNLPKAADRQRVREHANELQVSISMAGIDIAKFDETASKMMSWSLIEAGVDNMNDLKAS
jgi:hypothetical protein